MASNTDLLYTHEFENYIIAFSKICSGEIPLIKLIDITQYLKTSQILKFLMSDTDHADETAVSCVRHFLQSRRHLPQDFLTKFMAVFSLKINLVPSSNFRNHSLTAKVKLNNIKPSRRMTNSVVKARQNQLKGEAKDKVFVYNRSARLPPQVVKLKFAGDGALLKACVNAMKDYQTVIESSNSYNGMESSPYIGRSIRVDG